MDCELRKNRKQDIEVEDISKRSLPAKLLDGLGPRDAQETHTHEHTSDGDLIVTEFDTVEVLDRKGVGGDKTVEGENLVHLNRGHKGASTLSDDVRDGSDVGQLRGEWSGARSISKLDLWDFRILVELRQLSGDTGHVELSSASLCFIPEP